MKHLQVKQVLTISPKTLQLLQETLSILEELEDDFIDLNAHEDDSLDTLMCTCEDVSATLSDFLDTYSRYVKESE